MLRKQHIQDLLSDKIVSRFICVIDNVAPFNQLFSIFWRCLLLDSSKRRQSILVTSSQASTVLPDSVQQVFIAKYQCTAELFTSIAQLAISLSNDKNDGHPIYVFIDCLEWLLLDCPQDQDFDQWTRHLVALLLDFSSKPHIRRLVIAYSPLVTSSTIVNSSLPTITGAREVMSSLDQCCTSQLTVKSHNQANEGVLTQVLIRVLHRRALQAESMFPTDNDSSFVKLSRKSAFCELAVVHMDSERFTLQRFLPADVAGGDQLPVVDQVMTEHRKTDTGQRDSVNVLPYLEASLPHSADATGAAREPLVHYQPDYFDDIDDEDPDDDLNI